MKKNKWYEKYFEDVNPSNGIFDNGEREAWEKAPCIIMSAHTKEYYDSVDNPGENFDWQGFWERAKKEYPFHSVHGGHTFDSEEKIVNSEYNIALGYFEGNAQEILGKKVLEIGYGFGGAAKFFKDMGCEYHGIDYTRSSDELTDEDGFHVIKKSGIPAWLMKEKFDVVYSDNVFQHLTQAQREEYFEQVAKALKPGGIFVVSVFSKTDKFFEDPKRVYAARFFGVATSVDEKEHIDSVLKGLGLKLVREYLRHTQDVRTDARTMVLSKAV